MDRDDLRIISHNVRGLGNDKKRVAIFNRLKHHKCDICFLQETYSSKEDEQRWRQEWGGTALFTHGSKHSKGVAILFRKSLDVCILKERKDTQGRFVIVKAIVNDEAFNLINVYAPNKEPDQVKFLLDLVKVLSLENINPTDNNIFGGDWNAVLDSSVDKKGGMDSVR